MAYWQRSRKQAHEHPDVDPGYTALDSLLFLKTSLHVALDEPMDDTDLAGVLLKHFKAIQSELEAHGAERVEHYSDGSPLTSIREVPVIDGDLGSGSVIMRPHLSVMHPGGQRYS